MFHNLFCHTSYLEGTFEPISVRDFPAHVQHLHANDNLLFTDEYNSVEPDHAPTSEVCMRPENQSKNRYANIKAYDHSRVKLTELPNEIGSDYINANRINVSIGEYNYIVQEMLILFFNDRGISRRMRL